MINYFDVYAPVVDIMAVFYILAWGIANNMNIIQVDIKTAFLYGDLEEEIYMEQPEGFIKPGMESHIIKLKKAIYGLKQAPLCWNKKLNAFIIDKLKFTRLKTDTCVYMCDGTIIIVFVDDLLIFGKSIEICTQIYLKIKEIFKCTNLGFPEKFLGMIITRVQGGIIVHQSLYIDSMLERFKLSDAKIKKIPLSPSVNYYDLNDESENVKNYQELLGSLLFAAIRTRPDIAHAVALLSRFTMNPKRIHYAGLKNILKYLKHTRDYGLFFKSNFDNHENNIYNSELKAYSDASFADVITDKRKSSNGYVITYNGTAIAWKATKSTIVVSSTCESEYVAMFCG